MSEMNHTPPPWGPLLERGGGMGWDIDGVPAGIRGQFEHKADALFARAAPDLLAALEITLAEYLSVANSGDCGFWDPEEESHVIAARAAIAKARGVS